ncbi:hypothetical protein M758_12G149700 [Ceratodon purpureus]|uniref:Phosphotransferase n=1 Tax=Ceratodon purpureus TaxID=3225 RepID=A0A8T0GAY5_CERPU|nr:hypothetical protein KC19_12G147100 [Ceratodon purpureus]KAG0599408.1 hypothetical protein M758_12G149700 [Ceratodon purpureus]
MVFFCNSSSHFLVMSVQSKRTRVDQVVQELFDFIAKRLVDFVNREGEEYRIKNKRPQQVRELGLTFSFPVKQLSVKSGVLIQWTKGFKIADGVGADVVTLLQSAINRQHGPKIDVVVLVNDTVGTLAGGRYWNDDVMVGMILGTGTNACYVERDLPSHAPSKKGEMVINMEWGGFWSSHLPRTYADEQLDNESVNPGQAGYEKMIGGMYLGEIVRRVLLRMAREASLFGGPVPAKLREPFILITPEMSKMHADESGDLRVVAKILRDVFGVQKTELPARRIVHDVCDIVTMRSARLAAAGIVGILKKIMPDAFDSGTSGSLKTLHRNSMVAKRGDSGKIVLAMDGGLYEHYTQYRIYMQAAVNELLSEAQAKRLVIQLSKDGSGIGATILAACHSQYRGQSHKSYETNEPSYAPHEKMVRFGDAHPNATKSQFTQYDTKPTNTQFTQYEKPSLRSSGAQSDRPNLCSSGAQSDRPNLCTSQSQSDMPNCQPPSQHSVSYIYGLNIFEQ